jgi:hypothetical protein
MIGYKTPNWHLPYTIEIAELNYAKIGFGIAPDPKKKNSFLIYKGSEYTKQKAKGTPFYVEKKPGGEIIKTLPHRKPYYNDWSKHPFIGFNTPLQHGDILNESEYIIDKTTPEYAKIIDQYMCDVFHPYNYHRGSTEELIQKTTNWVCKKLIYREPSYYPSNILQDFSQIVEGGFGVCRHRATLLKVICDDVIGRVSNIRAAICSGRLTGVFHAWNLVMFTKGGKTEVRLVDQTQSIAELTSPLVKTYLPVGDVSDKIGAGLPQLYAKVKSGL